MIFPKTRIALALGFSLISGGLSCSLFFKDVNQCQKKYTEAAACLEMANHLTRSCKSRVTEKVLVQVALEQTPDFSGLSACENDLNVMKLFCATRIPRKCLEL